METHLSRTLVIVSILLSVIGIIVIYSATRDETGLGTSRYMLQSMWFVAGIGVMYITSVLPIRFLQAMTIPVFVVVMILLVAVLASETVKGSSRWIRLGFIGIQPSELAKIAVIMALAQYLSQLRTNIHRPSVMATCGVIVALPVFLILSQPDLGTSIVFGAIFCGVLLWAGLSVLQLLLMVSPLIGVVIGVVSGFDWVIWSVFILIVAGIMYLKWPPRFVTIFLTVTHLAVGLGAEPLWDSLHDYQQQRVETFLNPQVDPKGAGYQIIQSKIAIGSGGLMGRGFLQGSQTSLAFLPEQHTDFIFSVIAEEFGFAGSMAVLVLYYVFILIGIYIAMNVKSRYQCLLAAGCVSVFVFHVIMNVGMAVGVLPIAGVPLPFLSYGGSFLMTSLILCGLLLNVWRHRFDY
ncbi:MAG: rod shape-determining protein RodA [Gemmatimonadetes bacterium]|nr:rod shape-determining protein RodA [Gemmatimonadota bacterium]MYG15836.1 rod shape-determining protein RodA [Gemmatimonadota bacterium]